MIDLARNGEFAILTLRRPQVLNALSRQMLAALRRAFDEVESSDAKCLIITGEGDKAFCAGADITELADRSVVQELDDTIAGQSTMSRLENLRQTSIALVNGLALGGGCELALACTFRIATKRAMFGLPEVKLGLVPGYGGTQRLPRLIGLTAALELMLSGRSAGAEEALSLGLVSRVVETENAMESAIEFGKQFSGLSLMAQRLIRDAATKGIGLSLADGLSVEAQASALSFRTHDGREGIQAFVAKRRPNFENR